MKDRIQFPNPLKIPTLQQRIEWIIKPTEFMEKATQEYPDLFSTSTLVIEPTPRTKVARIQARSWD